MSTTATDTDAIIIDELVELGEIIERPSPLRLSGTELSGITERARRALLGRGDRRQ